MNFLCHHKLPIYGEHQGPRPNRTNHAADFLHPGVLEIRSYAPRYRVASPLYFVRDAVSQFTTGNAGRLQGGLRAARACRMMRTEAALDLALHVQGGQLHLPFNVTTDLLFYFFTEPLDLHCHDYSPVVVVVVVLVVVVLVVLVVVEVDGTQGGTTSRALYVISRAG